MSEIVITNVRVIDLRFPTSRENIGSDAVNKDPDYSAAYCILETNTRSRRLRADLHAGSRQRAVRPRARVPGALRQRPHARRRSRQIWLRSAASSRTTASSAGSGPEKGVIHLATGALINAVWDLYARAEGKPLWRLLAEMDTEQLLSAIEFRYIDDAITRDEAREILEAGRAGRQERIAQLEREGYPAYTTSVGWFGFSDEKIRRLCKRSARRGLDALQAQGRRRSAGRPAPRPPCPRRDRLERTS